MLRYPRLPAGSHWLTRPDLVAPAGPQTETPPGVVQAAMARENEIRLDANLLGRRAVAPPAAKGRHQPFRARRILNADHFSTA